MRRFLVFQTKEMMNAMMVMSIDLTQSVQHLYLCSNTILHLIHMYDFYIYV
jgi:hypothetical protein